MPDNPSPPSTDGSGPSRLPSADWFVKIIQVVTSPLGFFSLIVLVIYSLTLGLLVFGNLSDVPYGKTILIVGLLVILVLLILVVTLLALRDKTLVGLTAKKKSPPSAPPPKLDTEKIEKLVGEHIDVMGANAPPPSADEWYMQIRPVLHQVAQYTMPTYFLDTQLRVIDWNLAFELLFRRILSRIRNKHVNFFIVELTNREQVFDRAREFTWQVRNQGVLPLVHMEPLQYESEKYGPVHMAKVAVQLHDNAATHRGWAVGLMIKDIDWDAFEKDLSAKLLEDKVWTIYAAAYNRVVMPFPPYQKLVRDVLAAVPPGAIRVADLGAGTGFVTQELVTAGHRVTAVESNAAMLDQLRARKLDPQSVTVIKGSVENLDILPLESYDAAVMLNVLYAIDDPLEALRGVARILKPRGVLTLSTTHSETRLAPLPDRIRKHWEEQGKFTELEADYRQVREVNEFLEKEIALRYSRAEYREWLNMAGFEIMREIPSTYEDAVMVIHAQKR